MSVQLGGSQYSAETGRFDGTSPGTVNLPSPNNTVDEATVFFTNVGLTKNDMVNLIGTVPDSLKTSTFLHASNTSQARIQMEYAYIYHKNFLQD